MEKKIIIGVRKIGPGLKAFLKFNQFSGSTKIDLGGDENIMRLARQPLDPELFTMILQGTKHIRSNTRDLLLDNWLPNGIKLLNDHDFIRVAYALAEYTHIYYASTYTKSMSNRMESIVTRLVKPPFLQDKGITYNFLHSLSNDWSMNTHTVLPYVTKYAAYLNEPAIRELFQEMMDRYNDDFKGYDTSDEGENSHYIRNISTDQTTKALLKMCSEIDPKVKPYMLGHIIHYLAAGLQVTTTNQGLLVTYKHRSSPGRRPKNEATPAAETQTTEIPGTQTPIITGQEGI